MINNNRLFVLFFIFFNVVRVFADTSELSLSNLGLFNSAGKRILNIGDDFEYMKSELGDSYKVSYWPAEADYSELLYDYSDFSVSFFHPKFDYDFVSAITISHTGDFQVWRGVSVGDNWKKLLPLYDFENIATYFCARKSYFLVKFLFDKRTGRVVSKESSSLETVHLKLFFRVKQGTITQVKLMIQK